MANKILFKRGLAVNLPTTGLTIGEPYYTTDTNKLYIADSATTMKEYTLNSTLGTSAFVNTGILEGNVALLSTGGKFDASLLPIADITIDGGTF